VQGEGYLFKRLTKKIQHFGNVTLKNVFTENKDIPWIHQNFGIFLSPSRMDTQGVSMCEAMASGLVPITSPVGGIPEYCKNEVSGFLVKSANEIAKKIEYLYYNPGAFSLMSNQARVNVLETCDSKNVIAREINLIRFLAGKS
jgi:glycosyltransferase involved in cell wall biosynthesis